MKRFFNQYEYRRLLILTFLGDWVINAHLTDDRLKEYTDVQDKIFAFAKQFGLDECIDRDEQTGKIYPSRLLEEEALKFMEEYEDESFWDELTDRLARRDMDKSYGVKNVAAMEMKEFFKKFEPFEEKYDQEFYENGLDHVRISGCGFLVIP